MSAGRPAILYAEVPSFYAAVERARDPALRGRPVVVGGDPRKRGQVQSASSDALEAGVMAGMPMLEALERCPRAKMIKTDMKRYRQVSKLFKACLREVVDALEPSGLGAAYLDCGLDAGRLGLDPEQTAARLTERVAEALGLPVRVGVATVKFLAKLAAERAGEGGVVRVPAGGEAAFLRPLAVGCLPGVGPRTVSSLAAMGAHRVGDLLALDSADLEKELGNHGLRILEFARGEDDSRVRAERPPQSLGQEFTFEEDQLDMVVLSERLQRLAQGLENGLVRQGLCARRVVVKVRYADQETATRRRTQPRPVTSATEIFASALWLLDRTQAGRRPIRLLGVSLVGLLAADQPAPQLDLFEDPD